MTAAIIIIARGRAVTMEGQALFTLAALSAAADVLLTREAVAAAAALRGALLPSGIGSDWRALPRDCYMLPSLFQSHLLTTADAPDFRGPECVWLVCRGAIVSYQGAIEKQ